MPITRTIPSCWVQASCAALALSACAPETEPWARAAEISDLSETIGGPKAMAQPGDYILENDRVRVAILGLRPSLGPHTTGGSIADADLQRNDPTYAGGNGLDQLAELFPTVNLNVQTAHGDGATITILSDGADGGPAMICTEGPEQSFLNLLDILWVVLLAPDFRMRTIYELAPGDAAVKITTTAVFGDDSGCLSDLGEAPAATSETSLAVLDLALETGVTLGDFYLQGGSTDVFIPDIGFDEDGYIHDLVEEGVNTFKEPIAAEFLAGTADRVSYALAADTGMLFVPLFTSSQTVAVGAGQAGDGTNERFADGTALSYTRWFGLGRGDVGSAMEAIWEAKEVSTGRIDGFVVEQGTGVALSDVHVFATRAGEAAPFLEWTTDVGDDPTADGSFGGALPPGDYELLVHAAGRPDGTSVAVTVAAGDEVSLVLESPQPGSLRFAIVDETDLTVPAKLTVFAEGESPRDPVLGDGYISGDPAAVVFTHDGTGQIVLPPGRYTAVASRGVEYELHASDVFEIAADTAVDIELQVVRSVDTSGWISADFHVHAFRSHDSGVSLTDRATTMASEGVEYLCSTDHDAIVDYAPAIAELGLEHWLGSTIGLETTTIELGHFLGFPLAYDSLDDMGGALDWTGLTPGEIITGIHELGVPGSVEPLVFVAHPRDGILGYFDQYGLNPYVSSEDGDVVLNDTLLAQIEEFDQLQLRENFTLDGVEAIEVLNGKRFELIRSPTQSELDAYAADPDNFSTYEILARTMTEQLALEAGTATLGYGHEGTVDDWFTLLNLGYTITALGNSDTHGKTSDESGCPRNFILSDTDEPGWLSEVTITEAVRAGQVVASTGPFVRFYVDDETTGPGSFVTGGGEVTLSIEVQTPSWFDVDRVELYENGSLIAEWADAEVSPGIVNLSIDHTVSPTRDSWYTVIALGDDDLAPVSTTVEIPHVQLQDVVTEALSDLPVAAFLGEAVPIPRAFPVYPYAVTNPIWIDVDGDDAFTAPGLPVWLAEPEEPAAR